MQPYPKTWAVSEHALKIDWRFIPSVNLLGVVVAAALAASDLENPASELLRSFGVVSRDVNAALRQESNDAQRVALIAIENRLDGLLRELEHNDKLYAYRFRSLVAQWRQLVADGVKDLAMAAEQRREIDKPIP